MSYALSTYFFQHCGLACFAFAALKYAFLQKKSKKALFVLPITIFAYCISVPVLSRCGVSICDEKCAGILVRTVLLHHVLKLVCGDGA